MNNNQLLLDAYIYFAKFPELAAVLKSFNAGRSDIPGYDEFKTQIENTNPNSLIPEIKNYVFGVDEARVRKRIGGFTGYYLMVDYGEVQGILDSNNVSTDSFFIAVTVAIPFRDEDMDDAEEILITQQAYTYLMAIKAQMRKDDRESLTKHMKIAADADPFHAPKINNSIGWTLTLQRTGVLER